MNRLKLGRMCLENDKRCESKMEIARDLPPEKPNFYLSAKINDERVLRKINMYKVRINLNFFVFVDKFSCFR